jgi:hypothetical protein
MACSKKNILFNGGFTKGLQGWTGKNIKLVRNPVFSNDTSLLMGVNPDQMSTLKQIIQTPELESECAYYLYFRTLNVTPNRGRPDLYATVVYLDKNGKWLRVTPMLLILPPKKKLGFSSYFTIVPSPPKGTKQVIASFLLNSGRVFVDYIRFASHDIVGKEKREEVEKQKVLIVRGW